MARRQRRVKEIVGRRIEHVRFERVYLGMGRSKVVIESLVLDDGTELRTHAYESEQEPIGDLLHVRWTSKIGH